jgi:hypothetical protein
MNRMKLSLIFPLFLFFLLSSLSSAWATHIRAGEIIAERISVQTLTYRITVVGYTDTRSSVVFGPGILKVIFLWWKILVI